MKPEPPSIKEFYDPRFHRDVGRYLSQCTLATIAVFATLMALNVVPNTEVIAAIGASSFVVFAMPHKESSRARYIIGGYFIGLVIGVVFYLIENSHLLLQHAFLARYYDEIFGACAVGLTTLFMVIFQAEHPPAVGLALGLVLDEWTDHTILVTVLAIFLILLFRRILKPFLIDLI